jgi:hypothetical protein
MSAFTACSAYTLVRLKIKRIIDKKRKDKFLIINYYCNYNKLKINKLIPSVKL